MAQYFEMFRIWLVHRLGDGWMWVNGLSRNEWLVFLAVTAVLGFLCMRGYGSRNNY